MLTESKPFTLPILPLAENICPMLLRTELQAKQAWGDIPYKPFGVAWGSIELALADPTYKLDFCEIASSIGSLSASHSIDDSIGYDARLLQKNLTLLERRVQRRRVTRGDLSWAARQMGTLLQEITDSDYKQGSDKKGDSAEVLTFTTILNAGKPLYVGSPREERGLRLRGARVTHDGYIIEEGRKTPAQVKYSNSDAGAKGYDIKRICLLRVTSLACAAARDYPHLRQLSSDDLAAQTCRYAASWALGGILSAGAEAYMKSFTKQVFDRLAPYGPKRN